MTKETDYNAEWPGFEMKRIKGTDIYRVEAPVGVENIILDLGVTDREVARGKEAYRLFLGIRKAP